MPRSSALTTYPNIASSVVGDEADTETSSANAAVSITYTGVAGQSHVISGIAWSYSGAPTTGRLTVTLGSASPIETIFDIDIRATGSGFIPFSPGLRGDVGRDMVITLAAGGSGITGRVNVTGHWTE